VSGFAVDVGVGIVTTVFTAFTLRMIMCGGVRGSAAALGFPERVGT